MRMSSCTWINPAPPACERPDCANIRALTRPARRTHTGPSTMNHSQFCGRTRREFLWEAGAGFTGLALTGLLAADGFLARQAVAADGVTPFANPLAPKKPPLPAKATSVIFLFMYGGPSHVDTFEHKPKLYE